MSAVTILHNPRCSKSRQTLSLLEDKGIAFDIIEYLKTPIDAQMLENILEKLNVDSVIQIMRTKEDEFSEQNLGRENITENELKTALLATPKLLERPIVLTATAARIGRPPEQVLEIL